MRPEPITIASLGIETVNWADPNHRAGVGASGQTYEIRPQVDDDGEAWAVAIDNQPCLLVSSLYTAVLASEQIEALAIFKGQGAASLSHAALVGAQLMAGHELSYWLNQVAATGLSDDDQVKANAGLQDTEAMLAQIDASLAARGIFVENTTIH